MPQPPRLRLTSRLRDLRTAAKLTQFQLSDLADVSAFTISRMEGGSSEGDRVSTAARLARALGCHLTDLYLFTWEEGEAASLPPLPRACEARGCVDGRLRGDSENPEGDPRGPAVPAPECADCLGTGQLHVPCPECSTRVPWALTSPRPEDGEAVCPDCYHHEVPHADTSD